MAIAYEVTLRPEQMDHIKRLLLREAEELVELTEHYAGFTQEQKDTFDETKKAIEELLEDFTVYDHLGDSRYDPDWEKNRELGYGR